MSDTGAAQQGQGDVVAVLPCPFCGGSDIRRTDNGHEQWLKCQTCNAIGPYTDKDAKDGIGLNAAWNRRTLLSSSRGEQGWRTIDSAPKDGRKMLGLIGEDEVGTIWWHRDAYEGEWWMDEADSEPEPTHWMPMPPAPGSAAPQPPSVSSEIDWEHVAKNGLAKCTPEHTWAEWVADRNAENERLSGCLLAMAAATENVSAEALRSVAYDTVMNLITPDIAKHQLLCRSASPVPQNGESE